MIFATAHMAFSDTDETHRGSHEQLSVLMAPFNFSVIGS